MMYEIFEWWTCLLVTEDDQPGLDPAEVIIPFDGAGNPALAGGKFVPVKLMPEGELWTLMHVDRIHGMTPLRIVEAHEDDVTVGVDEKGPACAALASWDPDHNWDLASDGKTGICLDCGAKN